MLHEFYDRKYFWLLERLAGKAYLFALRISDNFWLLGWDHVGIAQEECKADSWIQCNSFSFQVW